MKKQYVNQTVGAAKEYINSNNSKLALHNIEIRPYFGESYIAVYTPGASEYIDIPQSERDKYITISYLWIF